MTKEELLKEVEDFLTNSSVWDSDYIYTRKAKMLEQFKELKKLLK